MATPRTDKPNIVVFFTDQQRWDSTGVHGNPLDLTPNFDRIAMRGTHCWNAYTCQPVCMPARSSLQTGKYASETGCFTNAQCIRPDEKTLGHWFREAGYHTAYIGKWHLCNREPVPHAYRSGYDTWLGSNVLEFTSDAYDTVMYDNDDRPVHLPGYRVDAVADAGIRALAAHRDEPLFLMLSFIEPHHQNHRDEYAAPEGYRERYQGRWMPPDLAALGGSSAYHLGGYWGCIKRLDEAFGRVLDAIRSLGLRRDTIVVFTSDHGSHFKTRNAEYKRACHDGCSRIPLAFCGPGFEGGGRVQELVSLVDLPPTLLDAAGLAVPETMRGHSLMPLLRRQPVEWPREVFLQISESQVGRALRTERWKYAVHAPDKHGGRDPFSERYVEQFLYDMEADPYEQRNLIGLETLREVTEDLRQRLVARIREAEGREAVIEPAPTVRAGQMYNPGCARFPLETR
ncbi:MAG: sulfatase-like hydrolase/transferase [Lentisphaeria bacterium]|nr:sulfatase-like hydrolase/transferase [Lentisphaeria bacterium]